MSMTLTAHCIIKNEEKWIEYVLRSVVDQVDCIFIFDTGSTDSTVSLVQKVAREYPTKIIFEEKGSADKRRHTELRQEMVQRTTTDWFMILDGDEVWTKRAVAEAKAAIVGDDSLECLIAPFHLCVGDVYHETRRPGQISMLGRTDYFYPRFFRNTPGIHWSGDYNNDVIKTGTEEIVFEKRPTHILTNRFWHLTHLRRSAHDDAEYSSGGTRASKRVPTYFVVGKRIAEPVPEVFASGDMSLGALRSLGNGIVWLLGRLRRN